MTDMDLYDPEFPCDDVPQDGSDAAANHDVSLANTTLDESFELQLSSIELPPEPYNSELPENAETGDSSHKEQSSKDCSKVAVDSSNKEHGSKDCSKDAVDSSNKEHGSKDCSKVEVDSPHKKRSSKVTDNADDIQKKSNPFLATENSVNKIEDVDGDEAIEDDARYRDELKKLTAVRQSKESESKSAKDVPLEIYLGPSVGFRVDLTMNKSRKLSVETIAKKRHDDMFERLSPERRGKTRNDSIGGGTPSGGKADFKSPSKTPVVKSDGPEESPGEVSRPKKSGHNEQRSAVVESGEDSDRDLRSLLRKREAENHALLAMPRVLKMRHSDGKVDENPAPRSDETSTSRKSRPHDNDRDNVELSSRKRSDYGVESKRSKQRPYEVEPETERVERRDGSASRKTNAREKEREPREKDSGRSKSGSGKLVRDEYEARHLSEERPRGGKNKNKELSSGTNKSRERERPPEIETDHDPRSRRKRHSSQSTSNERKKKPRKSKSRSPKRKRDRSKSKSDDRRRTKAGRSRSREQERRHHEKKSEQRPKSDDRHPTPTRLKRDERHRHDRSWSKSPLPPPPPVREPDSKKSKRSRHSDFKESTYYDEQWSYDENGARSDRHKSKQPSLRELQERSTSLLEACMKTRYENQTSGDDRRRTRRHRRRDFAQSLNFGRTSGKPGSVDYITLSDSDEGIVWSDNDEAYGDYSCPPMRSSDSAKKQKFEDIYSSRNLPCVESRLPSKSRSPSKPSKSRSKKKASRLSPSEIIAINLKKKEHSKRIERLKITKSVSRSSLEPGEIDDGSSVDLSDAGLIEEGSEPMRRTVSLVNDDDASRRPGDKVPIQIHVITSHGDGRSGGKTDEIMTDFDENVTGFVTTTDDAVGTAVFSERGDQRTDAQAGQEEDEEEMCADDRDSDDKELAGDLVICTENSPAIAENHEPHLKAERDGHDQIYNAQSRAPFADDFKKGTTGAMNSERLMVPAVSLPASDSKARDIFEFVSRKDDSSCGSTKHEAIPGLDDSYPSPVKDSETESSSVATRNLSSLYHIKKKSQLEPVSLRLDLDAELATLKAAGPRSTSPRKATIQKDDPAKAAQYSSPRKSPHHESSTGAASHQMPCTLPQVAPKAVASSGRAVDVPLTVDPELPAALPSDRKAGIPKPSPSSNAYLLNQNAFADLLATFPSSSSSLVQPPPPVSAAAVASHDDNPISKLLAAFNPMLATLGSASTANSHSQKLIDDIVRSSSGIPGGSQPQLSIDSRSGSTENDRLTSIFNMQKKLLELTRISTAPQPPAPISQKLVQDIFKAVLVPVTSKSSSDLCPRASDLPGSLSGENSLSPSSPFNVDAASPLSGEIMSFSPPSIPDISSPPRKIEKTPKQTKPTVEPKLKTKNKDAKAAKSKSDEDVMDKKSKSDIQKVVVEEVKSIIRPFYSKGRINKDEYKEIMRKTVPSICNSKTQDFSKTRITIYVEAYIRKVQATRKYHAKKKDK